jgi:hypothetical protein
MAEQTFEIPKKCKAGVVVDEGPNFRVEVQDVDVPEIGKCCARHINQHEAAVNIAP